MTARKDGEIDRDGEKWGDMASVDKKAVVEQVKLVRRSQYPVSRRFPNLPTSPCPDSSAERDADYAGTVVRVQACLRQHRPLSSTERRNPPKTRTGASTSVTQEAIMVHLVLGTANQPELGLA